jgi:hypothetical protein
LLRQEQCHSSFGEMAPPVPPFRGGGRGPAGQAPPMLCYFYYYILIIYLMMYLSSSYLAPPNLAQTIMFEV